MGTGCGILGIIAAKKAGEVVAVDLNPFAVRCAKKNARINQTSEKMVFLQGDLLKPVRETMQFDLILFNTPYLPSEDAWDGSWLARAWAGGANGRQTIDRFILQAPSHVRPTGRVLLMQSTLTNVEETVLRFAAQGMAARVVASLSLPFFETLTLLEATPKA